jgi:hypothetical protein
MNIRYIECGKIFLTSARGALEYSFLDRSDNDTAIESINDFYLSEVAKFGEKSASDDSDTKLLKPVAVALISWNATTYLFMQLQQRKENEFVNKDILPETQRVFNQARFSFIGKNDFKNYLQNKKGIVSSLIYDNPKYPGQNKLKDYIDPQRGQIRGASIKEKIITPFLSIDQDEFLKHIINALYSKSEPDQVVGSKASIRKTKPLFVIKPNLELTTNLQFFDMVQYWVYPALGVITYASDYVTDRQVTLFLCKDYFPTEQVDRNRVFDENSIKNTQFEDYFGAVSLLSEDELYHETLIYYLRTELSPQKAVKIFRLIETISPFSIEETIEIIQNFLDQIQDDHLEKIIQRHFISYDQLQRLRDLLTKIPVNKRLVLLKQILVKTKKNLAKYYPFHLGAIAGLDTVSQDTARIREFLRESVLHSSPEALDSIQDDVKNELFLELIWLDYTLSFDSKFASYQPSLHFATTTSKDANDQLMLQVLMERHEDAFFETIRALSSTRIGTQLINQITKGLEKNWCVWNLEVIYKFWQVIPVKTTNMFILILRYLLKGPKTYSDFLENPLLLERILIDGRDIFRKLSKENQLYNKSSKFKGSNQTQLLEELLFLREREISLELRKVCVNASCPLTIKNVIFGYWWLIEELAFVEHDILIQDYKELIKYFSQPLSFDLSEASNEVLFLLSGGKLGGTLSIQKCVPIVDSPEIQAYINSKFYMAVIIAWLELDLKIPSGDIANLVNRLPDSSSDQILRKILLNKNKAQIGEITELDSQIALVWLENSKGARVLNPSGEDKLYRILLDLKKPTVEFVRYMLLSESIIVNSVSAWKEYSNTIKSIYFKKWKSSISDPFINNYIQLTSLLNCSFDIHKYQELIIDIANISVISSDKEHRGRSDIAFSTALDFIYENKDSNKALGPMICKFLNLRFDNPEFSNTLKRLNENRFRFLFDYMKAHSEFFHNNLKALIEAEYRERYDSDKYFINRKSSAESSNYYEPIIQPRKVEKKLIDSNNLDKPIKTLAKPSTYSSLELILAGVLILVVFTIIVLVFIALNDALFNAILRFFYGQR